MYFLICLHACLTGIRGGEIVKSIKDVFTKSVFLGVLSAKNASSSETCIDIRLLGRKYQLVIK